VFALHYCVTKFEKFYITQKQYLKLKSFLSWTIDKLQALFTNFLSKLTIHRRENLNKMSKSESNYIRRISQVH